MPSRTFCFQNQLGWIIGSLQRQGLFFWRWQVLLCLVPNAARHLIVSSASRTSQLMELLKSIQPLDQPNFNDFNWVYIFHGRFSKILSIPLQSPAENVVVELDERSLNSFYLRKKSRLPGSSFLDLGKNKSVALSLYGSFLPLEFRTGCL